MVTVHVSRLWTLSRGSYLRQRRDWPYGTHGVRPVLRVLRPTVVRPFESDLEHAAQGHAEVRIGVTTCHQGNPSMPDAAVAHRELVRVHGPRDRASSPPRRSALLGFPLGVGYSTQNFADHPSSWSACGPRSFYVSIKWARDSRHTRHDVNSYAQRDHVWWTSSVPNTTFHHAFRAARLVHVALGVHVARLQAVTHPAPGFGVTWRESCCRARRAAGPPRCTGVGRPAAPRAPDS